MSTIHAAARRLGLLLLAGAAFQAQASDITLQGATIPTDAYGYTTVGSQSDAAAYRAVVTDLVSNPATSTGKKSLESFDIVWNSATFGSSTNFAWKATVGFGVTQAQAGNWAFRAGVDFGYGGAVYVDGVAIASRSNDMWWAGSYNNSTQSLAGSATLGAGNHVLELFGMENCCDGGSQLQFQAPTMAGFATFARTDGLNAVSPVPEPSSFAMLGMSVGFLGLVAWRQRKARKQA